LDDAFVLKWADYLLTNPEAEVIISKEVRFAFGASTRIHLQWDKTTAALLTPAQRRRLSELKFQDVLVSNGSHAFRMASFSDELRITDAQRLWFKENCSAKPAMLWTHPAEKDTILKTLMRLTPEQRTQWKELFGKPSQMHESLLLELQ
jgi:Spy/CpxP family protein refolding chaperone